jgi:hypothetical protein
LNYYHTIPFTGNPSTTTYTYYVEVNYSDYPCAITSDVAIVTVEPAFNVTINGDPNVCDNSYINLTALITNFSGDTSDISYEWRMNGNILDSALTTYDTTLSGRDTFPINTPASFRVDDTLYTATNNIIYRDSILTFAFNDTLPVHIGDTNNTDYPPYTYYFVDTIYQYNSHYFEYARTVPAGITVEFPFDFGPVDTVNNVSDWKDTIYNFVEEVYYNTDTADVTLNTTIITSTNPALVSSSPDTFYLFKDNVYQNPYVVSTSYDTVADYSLRGSQLRLEDGIPYDTVYTYESPVYTYVDRDTNQLTDTYLRPNYQTSHGGPSDTIFDICKYYVYSN